MGNLYLEARLDALRRTQNPDGGWGYFSGKQSWLEPTAYAALALHGEDSADRAWKLLRSWQNANGSWRPSTDVQIESWGTSLCVTIAAARGEYGEPFQKGVAWLLATEGIEANALARLAAKVGLFKPDRNLSYRGWPWKPNTSSWVEPTSHALVALKQSAPKIADRRLNNRLLLGHSQLLDVRCRDGGWNYGSRAALEVDLPSYPETTGIALVGLQHHAAVADSVELAARMARENVSPLARVWLTMALKLHDREAPEPEGEVTADLLLTALEALSCAHYTLFKTGGEIGT